MKRTRSLKVIKALDSGVFAVSLEREDGKGHQSRGRLNFDQVIAILEQYFVFNDDSEFTKFDELWDKIDELYKSKGITSGTVEFK